MRPRLRTQILACCLLILTLAGCAQAGTATPLPATAPAPPSAMPTPTPDLAGPIRQPAVAGQFYPGKPDQLRQMVQALLYQAGQDAETATEPPLALIVPHAGYVYSGAVAARAYAQVIGHNYEAIVILGANHTMRSLAGAAIYPQGSFATPLGVVPVAQELAQEIGRAIPDLVTDPKLHRQEHSIEVQLPFLQIVCPGTPIVPIIVGDQPLEQARELGETLAKVLQGRQVLIVVSTDLSHYPSYRAACEIDGRTLRAIASLDPQQVAETDEQQMRESRADLACTMCGRGAVLTALAAARALGAEEARLLLYANSGDLIFGDRERVVGYAAFAIWRAGASAQPEAPAPPPCQLEEGATARELTDEEQARLLTAARETLEWYLGTGLAPLEVGTSPALYQHSGAFVTLKKRGELRGCIGNLTGKGPLILTIQQMAIAAATEDQRFPPVDLDELAELQIEISLLSPPKEVAGPEEIQVGLHGVVLVQGEHRAVYLPQVAREQGWDRDTMLDRLAQKAGLPPDAWRKPDSRFYVFTAQVFEEEEAP